MCARVKCQTCNKPTYAGCGRHVEQVLGDVPVDKRCSCRETDTQSADQGSILKRLFGG